jgi:predicted RNA-binding protein with PUA-like domain
MAHWLVKQEPTTYSWDRLVREGRTRWDGVHNAQALLHLRRMQVGDEALFYHSGEERACIGILRIASEPRPDPDDARKSWYVEVVPVRPLARPVTLTEIRGDPRFAGIELLRNSRLSVMPLPESAWKGIVTLAAAPSGARGEVKGGTKGRAKPPARPRRASGPKRTR